MNFGMRVDSKHVLYILSRSFRSRSWHHCMLERFWDIQYDQYDFLDVHLIWACVIYPPWFIQGEVLVSLYT